MRFKWIEKDNNHSQIARKKNYEENSCMNSNMLKQNKNFKQIEYTF